MVKSFTSWVFLLLGYFVFSSAVSHTQFFVLGNLMHFIHYLILKCAEVQKKLKKKLSDSTNSSSNTELNPLKVWFFLGGESNESVMVLHHTPKIYELIHEGSVSTVTLNQLISMRWCQSPSSIWLELIDQANILLVQSPAFNECYLLHWWQGGRNKNHLLLSFPQMLQMEDWVTLN